VAHGVPSGFEVPGRQGVHVAAAADVTALGPKKPAAHSVPMHADDPCAALYVPLGHARQRSEK
jgi:hypothetical protein